MYRIRLQGFPKRFNSLVKKSERVIVKCPYCSKEREEEKGASYSSFCNKDCFLNHKKRRKALFNSRKNKKG